MHHPGESTPIHDLTGCAAQKGVSLWQILFDRVAFSENHCVVGYFIPQWIMRQGKRRIEHFRGLSWNNWSWRLLANIYATGYAFGAFLCNRVRDMEGFSTQPHHFPSLVTLLGVAVATGNNVSACFLLFREMFSFKDAFDLRECLPCARIKIILIVWDGDRLFSSMYVSNSILEQLLWLKKWMNDYEIKVSDIFKSWKIPVMQ